MAAARCNRQPNGQLPNGSEREVDVVLVRARTPAATAEKEVAMLGKNEDRVLLGRGFDVGDGAQTVGSALDEDLTGGAEDEDMSVWHGLAIGRRRHND